MSETSENEFAVDKQKEKLCLTVSDWERLEEEAQGTKHTQQQNLRRESLGLRAEEGWLPSKPNYEARHIVGRCSM
jgi:hypothetical protein